MKANILTGFGAVARQEWLASRQRIVRSSIVLASVMLGAAAVNIASYLTHASLTFFCAVSYIAAFVCFAGVPIYSIVKGSGNIHPVLFGETAPLALLVPVRAATLLAGKQLVNAAEYVIYAVPSLVYLLLMTPTGTFLFRVLFPADRYHIGVYWDTTKEFFNNVFIVERLATVHIALLCIVFFVSAQAVLNCAAAIYSAFVRGSKSQKRPSKLIMFLIIVLLFYLPARLGTLGIENANIGAPAFAYRAWPYMARLVIFAAVYFALTAYLMEKKIEVW